MKKRFTTTRLLALTLALALLLAACGGGGGAGGGGGRAPADVNINNSIIENYVYLPTFVNLSDVTERVYGSVAHGDRIFFYYVEHPEFPAVPEGADLEDIDLADYDFMPSPPDIVIANVAVDGSGLQRATIPAPASSVDISGFRVTDEGNFAMVIVGHEWDIQGGSSTTVFYGEFGQDGSEILMEEIDIVPAGANWFHVDRAFFTTDGRMVLTAWADRGMELYLVDSDRRVIGQIEAESVHSIGETQDGRVMAQDWDSEGDDFFQVLREIDFETGDFGEVFRVTLTNMRNLFPAPEGAAFDLLVDDGSHLFGYHLETGERTLILNWIEAGLASDWDYHVGFLANDGISVLTSDWIDAGDGMPSSFATELITLARTSRADVPERTIITLGAVHIWGEVRTQIVAFNRASHTHEIRVRDYGMYNTD
ncbi:MAG: hypothetical protein FWD84_04035, partial [Oscillospiraceae bacterium]|nr:hypothetical protein [Oscillospiraceae bacterium]